MVGRGAQGNPWALREIVDGDGAEATREEIVAELVLFVREAVRELGERRASGLPQEVLRLVPRRRPLPEGVQAGAPPARLDGGGRAPPARGRARRDPAPRGARGRGADGRGDDARAAGLDLRRRLGESSPYGSSEREPRERGRHAEPDVHRARDVALRPHEAPRSAEQPARRPRGDRPDRVGHEAEEREQKRRAPRSARPDARRSESTNCGRNARKKSAVFGFSTFTTIPCANARRRLRSPPSATSASGRREKSVQSPSPMR